ncbi:hypothetical protein AMTRI_Chr05g65830 [Amborella trichopoda]|uniref:Uncharacterized protein n=1 Tax=Amborella trichopoda TaxID=13333 RepID=W1P736_AMBTC|nr:putative axial regulator YABBY 2 isoform X2 [Amborella trichopoda]ERN03728.1 hypothetical protein AMTR_s00078p00029420 [Amborella trichopoda]|eukprot:XP_006842053.1 putative axial regulator YABBY 2 isoform X2 [Amborella trichopoda]
MSNCNSSINVTSSPSPSSEHVCYLPCNFCNTILAVSVPCSSLFKVVTVRCGHCTNLLSVNMAAVLHAPSLTPAPANLQHDQLLRNQSLTGSHGYNRMMMMMTTMDSSSTSNNFNHDDINNKVLIPNESIAEKEERTVVNRPPEKRQRVPSAYNRFIKEEIQRIKASNPDISHREAFSTAAKNWAHFPHIHFGLMLDTTKKQPKLDQGSGKHLMNQAAVCIE